MELSQGYVVRHSEDGNGNDFVLRTDRTDFALFRNEKMVLYFGSDGHGAVETHDRFIREGNHKVRIKTRWNMVDEFASVA